MFKVYLSSDSVDSLSKWKHPSFFSRGYFPFFLQVVFFFCRKDKDNVLCRQPDKNVTFATMNHKYLETGGMDFYVKICSTPSSRRWHEGILACSILYWFWEFRAPHHSLDKIPQN